jgi:hypothetical protein
MLYRVLLRSIVESVDGLRDVSSSVTLLNKNTKNVEGKNNVVN